MPRAKQQPEDFIEPLNMNGLQGRMMYLPSSTKSHRHDEILFIYGHHAMVERWWGLAQNLNRYGNVTIPDLPGFGGMESFAKIDKKPNIDAYADYLAAFIKLRYKTKKVKIVGLSFGFVVVTRMLQRYPELAKRVDLLVGMVGFMHKDDIRFRGSTKLIYKTAARFLATRPVAFIIRYGFLNKPTIRFLTNTLPWSKHRFVEVTPDNHERSLNFEVKLWQANDVRTHWLTTGEFLTLNNCKKHINLPIVHIISEGDHYLSNVNVESHMRQTFSDYKQFSARSQAHVPSVIADKKEMSVLLPPGLRKILNERSS